MVVKGMTQKSVPMANVQMEQPNVQQQPAIQTEAPAQGQPAQAERGRVAPSVAPAAKTGKETDLLGDDTQAIAGRQALADREREQDAKRNGLAQDAPDAAGFNLTGSDSARDQAAAAGQTELPLSAPAQETTDTPINSPSKKDQRKLKSLKLERVSAKGTVEITAADLLSLADEKLDKVADMLRKCGG
jgi:hypothetical protein